MRLDARNHTDSTSAGGTAVAEPPARRPPAVPFTPVPRVQPQPMVPPPVPAAPAPTPEPVSAAPAPLTGTVHDVPPQPQEDQDIISNLLILDEYRSFGLETIGGVGPGHWVQGRLNNDGCRINAKSGHWAKGDLTLSFFEFAAEFGTFIDSKAARRYYAQKVALKSEAAKPRMQFDSPPAAPASTPVPAPVPAPAVPPAESQLVSTADGQTTWQCPNCGAETRNDRGVGSQCLTCASQALERLLKQCECHVPASVIAGWTSEQWNEAMEWCNNDLVELPPFLADLYEPTCTVHTTPKAERPVMPLVSTQPPPFEEENPFEYKYVEKIRVAGDILKTELRNVRAAETPFGYTEAIVSLVAAVEGLCDIIDYEESPETAPAPEQREQIAAADPTAKPLIEATLEDCGIPEGICKLLRAGGVETYGHLMQRTDNGANWAALTQIKGIGKGKVEQAQKACEEHVATRKKQVMGEG